MAEAIRRGDADATVGLLGESQPDVRWLPIDITATPELMGEVRKCRSDSRPAGAGCRSPGASDRGHRSAWFVSRAVRPPTGTRRGVYLEATVEGWLESEIEGFGTEGKWYIGRPLLVTTNDYSLRLYNGDTGVVVAGTEGRPVAVFERGSEIVEVSPSRLASVDTVYAMTVHKAQGSQFDTVAVLLPGPESRILTRELLYTAVTRGRSQVIVGRNRGGYPHGR